MHLVDLMGGQDLLERRIQADNGLEALQISGGDLFSAQRGEVLIGDGVPAQHCFLVLQGALRVWRPLADGRRQITSFVFPGDWVGLSEFRECNANVEAVTRVRAERYPLRLLLSAAATDRRVATALQDLLHSGLKAAQERILVLGHRNTREKLASFLLEMSDRLASGGNVIALPMSRYDIGDYLGMSSETVCRNFTQFVADGIITLPEPNQVHILRREMLEFIGLWP